MVVWIGPRGQRQIVRYPVVEIFVAAIVNQAGVAELGLDDVEPDHLFGVERCQPPDEVLQLTDVPWPAMNLQSLHSRLVHRLGR